jgi:hypothetical protein
MAKHPIQPVETDRHGRARFKANAIVRHLLDHGGIDMNRLADLDFSREDREQFAQLIGYSLGGYAELGYVSDDTLGAARLMAEAARDERDARIEHLEGVLDATRRAVKAAAVELFRVHPDDLRP